MIQSEICNYLCTKCGKKQDSVFASAYTYTTWRREWLPTAVFWTGEFHGLYSPWGHKESDMIERLSLYIYKEILEGYGGG